jgi:hypothetical protein
MLGRPSIPLCMEKTAILFCSLHFTDQNGPTSQNPDPINLKLQQVEKRWIKSKKLKILKCTLDLLIFLKTSRLLEDICLRQQLITRN